MRKYVIQLTIQEGDDEFWEDIINNNKSGCDEVMDMIDHALGACCIDLSDIKLVEYTNKDD